MKSESCHRGAMDGRPYSLPEGADTAALTAITAAMVGVILNLAVWFGLHVIFDEVRTIRSSALNIDAPVWSTLNLSAAALVLLAIVAVFRFKLGPVTLLAGCAVAGLALHFAEMT